MKTLCVVRTFVSVVAIACSVVALASPPQGVEGQAVELDPVNAARASLTMDCARLARPSQGEFARLTGIANTGQAYAARARLMGDVRRACHSFDVVRVIGQPQLPATQALARVAP